MSPKSNDWEQTFAEHPPCPSDECGHQEWSDPGHRPPTRAPEWIPVTVHTAAQGVKKPRPSLREHGQYIVLPLNSGISLTSKSRGGSQAKRRETDVVYGEEKDKTPAERAEIPAVQRGRTSPLQMFGSHSKHENCLFPPTPQTRLTPRPWLRVCAIRRSTGKAPQAPHTARRTKGRPAVPAQDLLYAGRRPELRWLSNVWPSRPGNLNVLGTKVNEQW